MYIFYVDECGRPSLEDKALESDPWFVMAAAGVHSSHWLAIDAEITRLKQKYFPGIKPIKIEFKSTNIRSAGGPHPRSAIAQLKPDDLNGLVEELYAIYETIKLPLFSVAIQRKEHKDKYQATGQRPEFPYQLASRCWLNGSTGFWRTLTHSERSRSRKSLSSFWMNMSVSIK